MKVQPIKVAPALARAILRFGVLRASRVFCLGAAALLSGTAVAQTTVADERSLPAATLPLPSGDPLKIDFAADVFLRLLQSATPGAPFRGFVGAAVEAGQSSVGERTSCGELVICGGAPV